MTDGPDSEDTIRMGMMISCGVLFEKSGFPQTDEYREVWDSMVEEFKALPADAEIWYPNH